MAHYVTNVEANTNSSAGTEDQFVELKAAASTSLLVKRVAISCNTVSSDALITIRFITSANAGSGGTSGTAVPKRKLAPASTATVNIKNASNNFTLGSSPTTVDRRNMNGRASLEWIPLGNEELIESPSGGYFIVAAKATATVSLDVSVEWDE
jgi:hypothetical protein